MENRIQTIEPKAQSLAAQPPAAETYRIALAQTSPILGDRRRNAEQHRLLLERARDERARLTIFPELSLTGYFLRDMVPDVALAADAAELRELAEHAGDASLICGFVEQSSSYRFYNSALVAHAGRIVHLHRKVYLPTYGMFEEGRDFAAGEVFRSFDAPWGRTGLLICEDFWHLSALTIMQAEGVDVLVCVANSPGRGIGGATLDTAATYRNMSRTYAQLLGAVVILVNRVGFEDGLCFWGGSLVAGPDGKLLAEAPLFDEALLTVDLDAAELRRQRIITPLARDERLLLTIEELQRIKKARYDRVP